LWETDALLQWINDFKSLKNQGRQWHEGQKSAGKIGFALKK